MENQSGWEDKEGAPYPLGATYIPEQEAFNFAIYSKYAEKVTLLIYNNDNVVQPISSVELNYLFNKSSTICRCRVTSSAIPGAKYYAYRLLPVFQKKDTAPADTSIFKPQPFPER